MVKIGSVKWQGRCAKHPRYDPEVDGAGGIRGGCVRCDQLLEIWTHHSKLVRLIREFGTRDHARPKIDRDLAERQMSLLEPFR
jgi:hypothetical protein